MVLEDVLFADVVVFGVTLLVVADGLAVVAFADVVVVFEGVFCVVCAFTAPATSMTATKGTIIFFILTFFIVKN